MAAEIHQSVGVLVADGLQDAGEVGISGVTVRLYDGAGTLVAMD